jgi:plasmid stabilization system protein ParE
MPRLVYWTERALRRIEEISDFVASRDPGAASRLIDQIFDQTALLAEHPHIGRPYWAVEGTSLRELFVSSYRVIYEVRDDLNCVAVLTVQHQRRQRPSLDKLGDQN